MDDVPQKRLQVDGSQSHASPSIILPKRPRSDVSTQPIVTSNSGREDSASSAVNARNISSAADNDDNDDDDDNDDNDDDDYTSSSGSSLSSSDGEGDEDVHSETGAAEREQQTQERDANTSVNENDEQMPSLPARRKPNIRRLNEQPSLLSKLSAFLPQMKSANEDLEREVAAGRVKELQLDNEDDDHSDGQYIEMNLGLGVLEEKRSGDDQSSGEEEAKHSGNHGPSGETNVLDKLMGKEKTSSEKPSIQELRD
ncbi:hypothetical protein BDW59DRAFT_159636 [Aspergillus cavernicola]|uniref:Uncharacterized protein n=1 Tax=Aspergillus cavernicola TaxID=176166 RepID=A0ABR4IL30_9EURO